MLRYTAFLIIILLVSCTPVKRQSPSLNIPERFRNDLPETKSSPHLDHWWKDFNDPLLNDLIERALKHNHDIKLAAERVLEARAILKAKGSELFPSINLKAEATRQKQSFSFSPGGNRTTITGNSFMFTPVVSYELDLWQRINSSRRASYSRLISTMEAREAVMQTVLSDLVTLYFERLSLERKIELTKRRIKNSEDNLKVISSRYRRGLSSYLDLLQAKTQLSEVRARLPVLMKQAEDVSYRITLLAGQYPENIKPENPDYENYISRLRPVNAGIPSELLLRRPDLRVKAAEMEATFEELKVSRAKRFPSLSLTANYGWISDELRGLFKPESIIWQLSSGILSPLFDAGRLKSNEQAALSRYRQSLISYAKAVLQAFYEVETALMTRKALYRERQDLMNLLKDSKLTYDASLKRYQRGLVDLLTVLNAERQFYLAQEKLIDVDTAILKNRVFLYRALGGTWT
ncbi:MAG: TolC family protein [Nitrospirae bacterium]|nr:MAG: TolC family protein [Nitrospirota bacterium]